MWRLLLGTMGVKSLVQGLNAAATAGVPAKMSTRENVHLTILRQRILIRRQHSPVKRSRENVHQPRIWTPNSLHFAHAVHFAHGVQNLLLTFDCRSDWFWEFGTLSDLNLPLHKTSVLLTRLFHLVLSSNFRLSKKNAHDFAVWYRSSCAHDAARLVPLSKLLPRVKYRCFIRVFIILHSIVPSIPCLTTKWKNKTKTSITSWQMEKRNNNENEAPQRVNARRHQKPGQSPGSNRIPTPIRVNRFINSAKSSSSCFF